MLGLVVVAALQLVEPHSGIAFDVPADLRCVYLPEAELGPDCAPGNAKAIANMKAEGGFLLATNPDAGVVLVGRTLTVRNPSKMSDEDLDKVVRSTAAGLSNLGTFAPTEQGGHLYRLLTYGEVTLASYRMTADFPTIAKHPNRASLHGVLIPTQTEFISLMETAPEPDDSMRKLLLSLKAPPGFHTDSLFGTGGPYRVGQLLSLGCMGLVCPGGIVVLLVWLVLRARRERLAIRSPS